VRIGDRVALDGVPGTRGRVVRILSATRVRVWWELRPDFTRRATDEPIDALQRSDPIWLDPSGRPCPTVPCPRYRRATPLYRQPGATLWGRPDWRPFQIERTPSWCGHSTATVRVPEGQGWWREVQVLETGSLGSGNN
jgi:hypothetical protein